MPFSLFQQQCPSSLHLPWTCSRLTGFVSHALTRCMQNDVAHFSFQTFLCTHTHQYDSIELSIYLSSLSVPPSLAFNGLKPKAAIQALNFELNHWNRVAPPLPSSELNVVVSESQSSIRGRWCKHVRPPARYRHRTPYFYCMRLVRAACEII